MTKLPVDLDKSRYYMIVQQIRPWNVFDDSVLDTLERLPRHEFVPTEYKNIAYTDTKIPLGNGQFMMPPNLEGRLLDIADIVSTDTILEIGTGSGYLTACLAKLGSQVTSVDIFPEFQKSAKKRLAKHNINNVKLVEGDASQGWDDGNKYDVIIVTGSIPVPHAGFHESLAIGGRLLRIVGKAAAMEVQLITRLEENEWDEQSLFETSVGPLVNAITPRKFAL